MNKRTILIIFLAIISILSCKESSNSKKTTEVVQSSGDIIIDQINEVLKVTKEKDKSTIYIDRAKRYAEIEAYDEAIDDLRASIKIDSLNPIAYHELSNVYMDYYQSKKALRIMRDVLEIYPDRIPSLLKYAEVQTILKQYDPALVTIDKIAKLDQQNAEAAFMLGIIMKETGDIRSAKGAFKTATKFDSQITDAWLMLGNIAEEEGDPMTEQYYKNAIKTAPKNVNALHSLAFFVQNDDRLDEAIDLYRQIIMIDKKYTPAYLNTGILQMEKEKYELALANFDILTKINPKSFRAYYFKGLCYEKLNDIKSAKDNYQNAINFKPDYKEAKEALKAINN